MGKVLSFEIDFNCCTRFAQPSHSKTLWVHDRQTLRWIASWLHSNQPDTEPTVIRKILLHPRLR